MTGRRHAGPSQGAGAGISDPRALLRLEVAKLTEAECREVSEYIDIMRSLRGEGAARGLFGDGFARRVAARCDAGRRSSASTAADATTTHA